MKRTAAIAYTTAAAVLALVVVAMRLLPPLEALELRRYDSAMAARALPIDPDSPVVQVAYTDALIDGAPIGGEPWGHPIPDGRLAELITRLLDAGAAVVAVDILRGRSVPPGAEALDTLVASDPRILWVHDRNSELQTYRMPAGLVASPERALFYDFPLDDDGKTRRGMLVQSDEGSDSGDFGLAFGAAVTYLVYLPEPLVFERFETGDGQHPYKFKVGAAEFLPFKGTDGGYRAADDNGLQTLLTYPRQGVPRRDVRWVMESPDAEIGAFVGGKLVFLGVTGALEQDTHATPIADDVRGLDVHAAFAMQVIDAAYDRASPTIRSWSDGKEISLALVAALAGLLAGALVRRPLFTLVIGVGAAAALWAFTGSQLAGGTWVPSVVPLAALVVGAAAGLAVQLFLARRQVAQLQQAMTHGLDPRTAKLVFGDPEILLGRKKIPSRETTATIVMTDLKGYTSETPGLGANLITWLDRYMSEMKAAVYGHQGFVKGTGGDSVYAVFGLDATGEEASEAAAAAIHCALSMRERLTELNPKLEADELPAAAMRVGINTGPVSVGTTGPEQYAIVGDTVNVAARLEAYGKDEIQADALCRIIVGEST